MTKLGFGGGWREVKQVEGEREIGGHERGLGGEIGCGRRQFKFVAMCGNKNVSYYNFQISSGHSG